MSLQKYPNNRRRPLYISLAGASSPLNPPVYTSNSSIHGHVLIDPTSRPQRVSLELVGRTKFTVRTGVSQSGSVIRQSITLFKRSLELFSSDDESQSYDILSKGVRDEDGKVKMAFAFIMPGTVELRPGVRFREKTGFCDHPGHVLPPSYLNSGRPMTEKLVEYYLEGSLFVKNKSDAEMTARQRIRFMPPAPFMSHELAAVDIISATYQQSRGTICRTHKLLPDWDPNEGLLKRMKERWKKDDPDTPYVKFLVLARVPKIAVIGDILDVKISLEHIERNPSIPTPPTVFLKGIRVTLRSILQARVPSTSILTGADHTQLQEDTREVFVREFSVGSGEVLYDGLRLGDLGMERLQNRVVPGFSSYGLFLRWAIEVQLDVECAKEMFSIQACKGPIVLVSGLGLGAPNQGDKLEEAVPPPYETPAYEE